MVFSHTRTRHFRTLLRQVDADDLLVVADIHLLVGERRHAPDYFAAERGIRLVNHLRLVDLLVALRCQFADDEVARLGEEEEAVAVLDDECRLRALRVAWDRPAALPQPLAAWQLDRVHHAAVV